MRRLLLLAPLALLVLAAPRAEAAFDIFNLRNSLVQFLLEQISTDDFAVTAENVEAPGDGVTALIGVAIADADGVWFEAERLSLQWDARRILSAELVINELAGEGVRVLRRPVSGEIEVKEDADIAVEQEPFSWPRAPITTRIERLRLDRVFLAEGVLADQSVGLDAAGSAADEGDIQAVALQIERTDAVAGQIDLDYRFDFAANTLRVQLAADEAAGGLVAAIAGLPNDSASRVRLDADGPLTDWSLDFAASTDRVIEAEGTARVDLEGPLAVRANFAARPGPAIDPAIAAVLGAEARLDLDVAEGPDGRVQIRTGRIESPALRLAADGFFDRATGAVALDVDLDGEAALSDLADGVAFQGFGFTGDVSGTLDDLLAEGEARLDRLTTEPADIGRARLATRVTRQGARIGIDVSGQTEGVRLDRVGPEVLGPVRLDLDGSFEGQEITLVGLSLASRVLEIGAEGRLGLPGDTDPGAAELSYRLSTPDLAPVAAAYDQAATGRLSASGAASGPLDGLSISGDAAAEALSLDGESYGAVTLSHAVRVTGERIDGEATLRAGGSPFGPVTADAAFGLADQVLDLSRLDADALGITLRGAVRYGLETGLADGEVGVAVPDLSTLEPALGETLGGTTSGRIRLMARDGRQDAAYDLDIRGLTGFGAELGALRLDGTLTDALGAPAVDAEIAGEDAAYALDGERLSVARLEGTVAARELSGDARADTGLTLRGISGFGATLAALTLDARFEDLLGAPSVEAEIRADDAGYTLDGERLSVARLEGTVAAEDLTGAIRAEADLALARLAGFGAELATLRVEAEAEDAANLAALTARAAAEDLRLADAGGADTLRLARLTADLEATEALSDARTARLDIEAGSLAASGATVSRTTLSAELAPRPDAPAQLTAELRTGPVRVPGEDGDALRLDTATLNAKVSDPFGADPGISASLRAAPLAAGPARLETLAAEVTGRLSALGITLAADGTVEDDPLRVDARATVAATETPLRARISQFDAAFGQDEGRIEAGLDAPLTITAGETVRAQGLALALPGGRVTGDAALHPTGLEADLVLAIADLAPLARIADAPVGSGSFEAQIDADTRPGRARGDVTLRARDLRFEEAVGDLGALGLDATGRWDGRDAALDAALSGPFGDPVRVTAALPLRASGGPIPRVPSEGALSGSVRWRGEINRLWVLVPLPDHVLLGQLDIDLVLSGTVADPAFSGAIRLENGRYENLEFGTIIAPLTLGSEIAADGALVLRLDGRDGGPGRIGAEIALDEDGVEAEITGQNAVLVRRDDVRAALSLDIRAAGPLAGPDIEGTVTIDRAEVRLVNATPPSVVTLGDVRIKGEPIPEPAEPAGSTIDLDLRIQADRNIFVRGRGLDSEWRMGIDVGGTAARPRVTGAIERVRGALDFIGTSFDLETGVVRFSGGREIDPTLDVRLVAEEDGIRGGIAVSGTASAPEIGFFSRPSLPEDEVLPRLLFGQSRQSLSPSQGIRLAAGLATLLDGGGGVIDQGRAAIGLDVLAIDPSATGDSATVTVGKNIGDDVFVGAKQSIDGAETSVTVEVEVFENVTVDGEIDQEGNPSVGVNWKRDF
ncbi:MAG: translocation/assembly module TamB domain-containing protein [Paracoccaceae bacterium]